MPWDLMQLVPNLMGAYTSLIPQTVFAGLIISILCIGMWRRNRSVKLVLVTFIICCTVLFSVMDYNIPIAAIRIGQILAAIAVAAIGYSIVRR